MTQDEIIEMVIGIGLEYRQNNNEINTPYCDGIHIDELRLFAELVEEKVTARYMQLFLDPENQPTQFGTATQEYREQEIKDEREACAKVCDARFNVGPLSVADEIRARGQQ